MAQDYDKIFKENIEEIILPLAEKILDIHPEKLEEIPDDLQVTLERKPDFLKKVVHVDSSKDYILQIEFQKEDEAKMLYRMAEYYTILLRKYELEVRQFVFFIGKGKAQMKTSLKHMHFEFSFKLLNLQEYSYKQFVFSDKPEEIILAILADFGKESPEEVVKVILEKLKTSPSETFRKEKCVVQLEVLSVLRNLQAEIIKQLEVMGLTYDLKNDLRFKQGIKEGQEKGQETKAITAIKKMLADNFSFEQIAKYLEVTVDFVKKIAKETKK